MKLKQSLALFSTLVLSVSSYADWSSSDKKTPEETIEIIDHQGQPLNAYLWLPENYYENQDENQQYSAVVLAHGCGGAHYKDNANQWIAQYISGKYKVWGKLLNEQNIMVLLVDSFTTRDVNGDVGGGVCGQSYNNRPAKIDPISVRPADIAAGIHYLKQRSDIVADKIGVLGFSNGGTSVLALANHESLEDRALELLDQQKSWFHLPFTADYQANTIISLYPGCGMNGYDSPTQSIFEEVFQTYTKTMIYAASDDSSLPQDTLEKCSALEDLDANFGNMDLTVIKNTDHQFDYYENDERRVARAILAILDSFSTM